MADKLAKPIASNSGSSSALSVLQQLPPMEQLLVKVQTRWRFPEMGELEYQDWRETLSQYPIEEVMEALAYLMSNPPTQSLPDGRMQEYRGRPGLVDVTSTIAAQRQEKARQVRATREAEEMRRLAVIRAEHPEDFIGREVIGEILRTLKPELATEPDRNGAETPMAMPQHDVSDEMLAKINQRMKAALDEHLATKSQHKGGAEGENK